MSIVKRLDLPILDIRFEKLTESKFLCCLQGQQPDNISDTLIIAIGAFHEKEPVGLLLASFFPILRLAEIHSLKATDSSSASQIMRTFEEELKVIQCSQMSFAYPAEDPQTPFLEVLLQSEHWSEPRIFQMHCRFDAKAFLPEWIQREQAQVFSVFNWSELTSAERHLLEVRLKQGVIPAHVSPFKNENTIESINSLGLRYKDEVVGWMITHREKTDTIRYSALYIFPEYPSREAIALLCESIWRQKRSRVPWAILDVNLRQSPKSWVKFVEKRLIPQAISITHTKSSWKLLT